MHNADIYHLLCDLTFIAVSNITFLYLDNLIMYFTYGVIHNDMGSYEMCH